MADDAVVATTIAPGVPDIFPDVPTEALDPVAMTILFPAVPRTTFPFVAVMLPRVAVMLVPALTAPAVAVTLPVVAVTPVPPVTVPLAETLPEDAAILPVVAVMPVPAVMVVAEDIEVPEWIVVVEAMDPGATKVAGIDQVIVLPDPVVVIWFVVPSRLMFPPVGVTATALSPVRVKRSPTLVANSSQVTVPPEF